MNRIKDYNKLATDIVAWIKDYADSNNIKSLVVGVSGGIDSAVVSTLCAMTGLPVYPQVFDCHSNKEHIAIAERHCNWLYERYGAMVSWRYQNLVSAMSGISIPSCSQVEHLWANTKSRLMMMYLYNMAAAYSGIVVGTGNKVEDFGIGFCTKGGDLTVDISPIADLYKTEVRELGRHLGISQEIIDATPTDGLFADGRTDEDQIGATYEELEWVMENCVEQPLPEGITERQEQVCDIYDNLHLKNQHKMLPIPIFKLNQ